MLLTEDWKSGRIGCFMFCEHFCLSFYERDMKKTLGLVLDIQTGWKGQEDSWITQYEAQIGAGDIIILSL